MVTCLITLPQEVITNICQWLDFADICSLCQTCSTLQEVWRDEDGVFWSALLKQRLERRRKKLSFHLTSCEHVQLVDFAAAVWCVSRVGQEWLSAPTSTHAVAAVGPKHGIAVATEGKLRVWSRQTWSGQRPEIADFTDSSVRRVSSLTFNATESRIAVGGADKAIVIYDIRGGQIAGRRLLRGHTAAVTCAAFLGDRNRERGQQDNILASGSDDTTIRLFNTGSRRTLGVLRGHGRSVSWLEGIDGGEKLVSSSFSDQRIKLWDIETCSCTANIRITSTIRAICVDHMWRNTVYVSSGNSVSVIDLRAGVSIAAILSMPVQWRNAGQIRTLTLREDGLLAAGIGAGAVAVWDATGPWEARGLGWPGRGGLRKSRAVSAVALTSRVAFAGCGDGRLSVLSLDNGVHYAEALPVSGRGSVAVTAIATDDVNGDSLAIASTDGSAFTLNMRHDDTVIDWEKAHSKITCKPFAMQGRPPVDAK